MPTPLARRPGDDGVQRIESCNSTWLFDGARMRFRRVPKGSPVNAPAPASEWRRYFALQFDDDSDAFVVTLNQSGTRLLRSFRHKVPCELCGVNPTAELALEPVQGADRGEPTAGA